MAKYAATMRIFATSAWPAVKEIFESVLCGAPLMVPSGGLADYDLDGWTNETWKG